MGSLVRTRIPGEKRRDEIVRRLSRDETVKDRDLR